jgi:hypothetical protein
MTFREYVEAQLANIDHEAALADEVRVEHKDGVLYSTWSDRTGPHARFSSWFSANKHIVGGLPMEQWEDAIRRGSDI